jgi:dGTP triphosphohydrolase
LRAGLFTVADMRKVPLAGPVFTHVATRYPGIETGRLIHESSRRLIDRMVTDVLTETRRRLEDSAPKSADDVRGLPFPVARFSPELGEELKGLKSFLFESMYRHHRVKRMTDEARRVVKDLFGIYLRDSECLPAEWRAQAREAIDPARARLVADYIAGMTDRFALDEHRRLFDRDGGKG